MDHFQRRILPLQGMTVAITSSRRASELGHVLEAFGAKPYFAPTVGIEMSEKRALTEQLNRFLSADGGSFPGVHVAIFITGVGVESIFLLAKELGLEGKLIESLQSIPLIIARSTKPKSALMKYRIKENVKMAQQPTFQGILELLESYELRGKNVALFWHGDRSDSLVDSLRRSGAILFEFSTYSYSTAVDKEGTMLLNSAGFGNILPPQRETSSKLIRDLIASKIDAIVFTSPPAVENFFKAPEAQSKQDELRIKLKGEVVVVSIGPSTSQRLQSHGVEPDVVPGIYKLGKMVESLVDYMKSSEKTKMKALTSMCSTL